MNEEIASAEQGIGIWKQFGKIASLNEMFNMKHF
jgi:hypothetical protein